MFVTEVAGSTGAGFVRLVAGGDIVPLHARTADREPSLLVFVDTVDRARPRILEKDERDGVEYCAGLEGEGGIGQAIHICSDERDDMRAPEEGQWVESGEGVALYDIYGEVALAEMVHALVALRVGMVGRSVDIVDLVAFDVDQVRQDPDSVR